MKPFKKGLLAAAAFLLLSTGTACATADPEVQLDTIANAEPLWKDEFVARWDAGQMPQPHLLNYDRSQTRFAVTDLDGNGRLELIFRHAAMLPVAEGITPYPLRHIPTMVEMAVYEIGTDGRLARLPETENNYGAPNLTGLALHGIDSNNTRWYNVDTSIISTTIPSSISGSPL
jgi:lipoprotein